MENQAPMFQELPVYEDDLGKARKKRPQVNCLQDMLLELMNKRMVTLAQIHKATKIPWATLQNWHDATVNSQLADKNLLELARFFNVSLFYLVYGIGTDEPAFLNDDESA